MSSAKTDPAKPSTITYGSVTIEAVRATGEQRERNIAKGVKALRRAAKSLATPGVKLDIPDSAPRYHADPKVPGRLVRVLDGEESVGTFKNGAFKPSDDGAEIDGKYRYRLWRRVPDATSDRAVLWIMLNPSTADWTVNDPTIRKVIGFSQRWGFGQARVVNLCALRATDPSALNDYKAVDVVGPLNHSVIYEELANARYVVLAWGANAEKRTMATRMGVLVTKVLVPDAQRLALAVGVPLEVVTLGLTRGGSPRHPLMLAYNSMPWKFS